MEEYKQSAWKLNKWIAILGGNFAELNHTNNHRFSEEKESIDSINTMEIKNDVLKLW